MSSRLIASTATLHRPLVTSRLVAATAFGSCVLIKVAAEELEGILEAPREQLDLPTRHRSIVPCASHEERADNASGLPSAPPHSSGCLSPSWIVTVADDTA